MYSVTVHTEFSLCLHVCIAQGMCVSMCSLSVCLFFACVFVCISDSVCMVYRVSVFMRASMYYLLAVWCKSCAILVAISFMLLSLIVWGGGGGCVSVTE